MYIFLRMCDVGLPSVFCEYILLSLNDKEDALACHRVEYI